MIKISTLDDEFRKAIGEDLYWKGKRLVFTWHFKQEWDILNKPLEFVISILEQGEHHLVSKTQNKWNVFYPFEKKYLCISYVEHENIILIHIKPTNKKREEYHGTIHENLL